MGALLLAPFYILVNFYVARWLLRWMGTFHRHFKSWPVRAALITLYVLLASTLLTGFLITANPLHRFLKTLGSFWLGSFLYILLTTALFDLGRLILRHSRLVKQKHLDSRAVFLTAGSCAIVCIDLVSGYGILHAGDIRVHHAELSVGKPCAVEKLDIALLADFHLGYSVGAKQMSQMVEKVNRQNPDLIVIAGDIFDNEYDAVADPEKTAAVLSGLKSRYGTFACWGNHDVSERILAGFTFGGKETKPEDPRFAQFLRSAGISLLQDESLLIDGAFYLTGRKDPSKAKKSGENRLSPGELLQGLDMSKPVLVMDHQPKQLQELADAGADIDLSGHTHDGQVFPGNLLLRLFWENPCGILKKGEMYSCVTSGIGVWGPAMRVGTDSEILMLHLTFENH